MVQQRVAAAGTRRAAGQQQAQRAGRIGQVTLVGRG
jgi:hypothetical protein